MAASNKNYAQLANLGGRKLSSDENPLIAAGAKQDRRGYLKSKNGQAVMDPKKQPKPIHSSVGPNSSADYNALVQSGAQTDSRGFLRTDSKGNATYSKQHQAAAKRALKAKAGVGAVRTTNNTGKAKKSL